MDLAQFTAIRGMNANKAAFDVISQNISNANNENYNSKVINFENEVIGGKGVGVAVSKISRRMDEFLQVEVRNQRTELAYDGILNRYMDRVQVLFGRPGEAGTLNYEIDQFFNSLNFLANNPDLKLQAVQRADSLTRRISEMAREMYDLRYDADIEFSQLINYTNLKLVELEDVQRSYSIAIATGVDTTSVEDARDAILTEIAEIMPVFTSAKDQVISVNTVGGLALFDAYPFQLHYDEASGPDVFVHNLPLNNVSTYPLNGGSVYDTANQILVRGGREGEISSKLTSGKLGALMQVRDVELSEILLQLDQLTVMLRDKINAIHNTAGSVPSPSELLGTYEITSTAYQQLAGSVRIAVIDNDGQPLIREDGKAINPLLLNLGNLDSGIGRGSLEVQTVIDEINQYFYYDPLLQKTTIGNLEDVRIASRTTNMVANGVFNFDFELVNNSDKNSVFSVENIQVYDSGSTLVAGALTTSLPLTQSTYPGDRIRSSQLQVDFAGGGGGPYSIQATVKVVDEDGIINSSVLEFIIDDTPASGPNIINDRYIANSIIAGSASFTAAGNVQKYIKAEIVTNEGVTAASGEPGFLKLKGLIEDIGIIIDDLDSEDFGYTYNNGLVIKPTYRGFSHLFQLNNFFVENKEVRNSALNLKVRDDVLQNSGLFSIGKLERSPSYIENKLVGTSNARADIAFAANPDIGSTITINGVTFNFVAAAVLDNEITIGASLAQTLNNIETKLSATNTTTAGTVDQANYQNNGLNTLTIFYNTKGSSGNGFPVSFNLVAATATLNNGAALAADTGSLFGGTNKFEAVEVQPNSYEIGMGATQAVIEMSSLVGQSFSFGRTGILSAITTTIGGYGAVIISTNSNKASQISQNLATQQNLYNAFYEKFREGSGVDLDKELASTVIYQNAYVASATILTTTNKLFESFMHAIRS
ncbi:FlgK family flagellar hook-associated protein [Rickettsiales endosymbiont of Stachyamoeba lipophora]|uniref:FlgK family flagellar hook-associated protein n=1 Tax=Rickettsiales endosymbiont of Stachyamoeba lipophora TaxID=2486578 RepID=UPI000F650642|nr:flagellar basal body rod C-terminal domain-containing protein [Rickettsiales endosymbiont of Stachyamoeba lipophora]AZL16191.1 hypothetical protein EF513_06575 [Rickettsiales endosymbiont of Stachyamoeba lipophora]